MARKRPLFYPGIGTDPQQFKAALVQMWFSLYRREVQNDSSGFEHVFLGESDDGQVKVGGAAMTKSCRSHCIDLGQRQQTTNLLTGESSADHMLQ